jgi:penicillin-binding protein 1A
VADQQFTQSRPVPPQRPQKPPIPPKRKSGLWGRLFMGLFLFSLVAIIFGGAVMVGGYYWISQDLPKIERLADYRPPAVTQVLARDGSLMAEFSNQKRYVISLDRVPEHLIQAFVSAEDSEFFNHVGVSFFGMLRAAWANLKAGRVVQGGSTITQQVAKDLLLSPERTMSRKLKEIILAYRIEKYLTKREILYLYLNQIYLGHGAYGVQAASMIYFGKDASQLVVAESALLAGLIKAPSRYSPVRFPRRARTRQEYVIGRLVADGHLTQAGANQALNQEITVSEHARTLVRADHYTEYVRQWLVNRYGTSDLYEGGMTVYTACDPKMIQAGEEAIAKGLAEHSRRRGFKGPIAHLDKEKLRMRRAVPVGVTGLKSGDMVEAVVVKAGPNNTKVRLRMGPAKGRLAKDERKYLSRYKPGLKAGDLIRVKLDKYSKKRKAWYVQVMPESTAEGALLAIEAGTGRVRAMIGGRDYQKSQFNRATQAHRQPGSAFKPFIYAAALDQPSHEWTPSTQILDAPVVYDDPGKPGTKWKPKNYEGRFFGLNTFRTALEHSRNASTIKILAHLGLTTTIEYAKRFGFTSELAPHLSLALGTSTVTLYELTRAYSVFLNQGKLVEPVIIEKVLDRHGEVIYEAGAVEQQVISPQIAFLTTHLMRGVVLHGTGKQMLELGRPLAGKTGTSNDLRDAWFMGFSPQLACGVWVGNDDNKPLGRFESGSRAAGPIWKNFMAQALIDEPKLDFPVPEGVVFVRVNPETGMPMAPGTEGGFFEAFLPGTQPQTPQPVVTTAKQNAAPKEAGGFLENETFAPVGPLPGEEPKKDQAVSPMENPFVSGSPEN